MLAGDGKPKHILEVNGLRKTFGGLTAVENLDLRLEYGELRCIIGPNGCGKTTLFNLITGNLKPTAGRVIFEGREITAWPVPEISRLGIYRKFQVPSVFEGLTVYENMRIPYFARMKPSILGRSSVSRNEHQEIMELLERVNLAGQAGELAGNLAHGQKQWLEIGMVLASRPRLMLLDEPTAGMTIAETKITADLVQEISESSNISVMVIEHDLGFVKEVARKITVMYKGSIFREGTYEEIQADKDIHDIYLGRHR